jgi:hypothetical protein
MHSRHVVRIIAGTLAVRSKNSVSKSRFSYSARTGWEEGKTRTKLSDVVVVREPGIKDGVGGEADEQEGDHELDPLGVSADREDDDP